MRRFYTQRKSFKKLGVMINEDSDTDDEENCDDDLNGKAGSLIGVLYLSCI